MPRYEERPSSRETNDDTLIWKIAIGVFVGILAAALVTYWVRMYFIQQALQDFNKSIQQISMQSQRSTQELQRQQALRYWLTTVRAVIKADLAAESSFLGATG